MTFLDLFKRVCERVGRQTPTGIDNLDRGQERLWNYVQDAYIEIQTSCNAWDFLTERKIFNVQNWKREYTSVELNYPEMRDMFEGARLLDFTSGRAIGFLTNIDKDLLDECLLAGVHAGTPNTYAYHKGILAFDRTPNQPYKMSVLTYRAPYKAVHNESPVWHEEHHMIVHHKALHKNAVEDNDPEMEQETREDYNQAMNRMLLDHSPGIQMQ